MKTNELLEVIKLVEKQCAKSQWKKGVYKYAVELAEFLNENFETITKNELQKACLNGATNWQEYSQGGCSLINDKDIAERLATNSQIKQRTNKQGQLSRWANSKETWLEVQSRALYQAYRELKDIVVVFDNEW